MSTQESPELMIHSHIHDKFKKRNSSTLSFYQRTDKLRYWGDSVTITGIGRVKVKGVVNFPKKPLRPYGRCAAMRFEFLARASNWYL